MITLETERLILRMGHETEPTPERLSELHDQYMKGFDEPDCPFEVLRAEVLLEYFTIKQGLSWGRFNMTLKESGEPAGHCALGPRVCDQGVSQMLSDNTDRGDQTTVEMDMGWATMIPHRRRGLAVEAARKVVEYAFGTIGVSRLVAHTGHDNVASQGVMTRLGMQVVSHPDGQSVIGVLRA